MDALSGVASGIAVVSLAIQLIECVGSIKAFIRNMKDAQKELERLVDLLERLEGLLEDVRALMERQASLEHFPTPSATIFKCLKGCEKTLEPLQAIVDRHTPSKSKASMSMDRLKTGFRVGFKTKDIQDFETRVEREINFLNASLGANCGAILLQIGPALLKNSSNHNTTPQNATVLLNTNKKLVVVSPRKTDTMLSNARVTRPSSSVIPVHSPLERLGIYQRKIVRRVPCTSAKVAPGYKEVDETIVSEDHETTLLWSVLGHGLTWIQRRSFGRVVPSLSTFPVVKEFSGEIHLAFMVGGLQDVQDLLRRGVIHPFSRDHLGRSLLHVAALHGRADAYLLLRNLGLKQNVSTNGETILKNVLIHDFKGRGADQITLFRYALEDSDLANDPILYNWQTLTFLLCSTDSALWLYQQIANILPLEDACMIRAHIIWDILKVMCENLNAFLPVVEYQSFSLDAETLKILKRRNYCLLTCIFDTCDNSYDSFIVGELFLGWISNSGIDVEQFISREVEIANALGPSFSYCKRVVFEPGDKGGRRLGFEFAFDREANPLALEYETLFTDVWSTTWPFDRRYYYPLDEDDEHTRLQEMRFQRRMAVRACKESGQKRRKSRMPGAWVH